MATPKDRPPPGSQGVVVTPSTATSFCAIGVGGRARCVQRTTGRATWQIEDAHVEQNRSEGQKSFLEGRAAQKTIVSSFAGVASPSFVLSLECIVR